MLSSVHSIHISASFVVHSKTVDRSTNKLSQVTVAPKIKNHSISTAGFHSTDTTGAIKCIQNRDSTIANSFFKNIFGAPTLDPSSAVRSSLLAAIEGSDRGVARGVADRDEIELLVDELAEFQSEVSGTDESLSGVWELLWTSEKETLFLLEKGIFRVGPAQKSFQVIDVGGQTLQNVIQFGENSESVFVVDSSLQVVSDKRCEFKFSGARLTTPNFNFKIPPFGQGWFENVYLNDNIRVARDIRGDTLITKRASVPLDNWKSV
eukprot:CAMPEP_0196591668 /NCGR_PEP_ID=MMETSP1081-20130531/70516_1 /TAXON_ID=36882 /ORGANISM="Pyramimonas amylifera, Strain CCMP720" /LENGTH=263 /DNA_ID=CAMNT_0041915105 /DNA_START=43 /DNA_END=834 /DNA_ORIENTATION=-